MAFARAPSNADMATATPGPFANGVFGASPALSTFGSPTYTETRDMAAARHAMQVQAAAAAAQAQAADRKAPTKPTGDAGSGDTSSSSGRLTSSTSQELVSELSRQNAQLRAENARLRHELMAAQGYAQLLLRQQQAASAAVAQAQSQAAAAAHAAHAAQAAAAAGTPSAPTPWPSATTPSGLPAHSQEMKQFGNGSSASAAAAAAAWPKAVMAAAAAAGNMNPYARAQYFAQLSGQGAAVAAAVAPYGMYAGPLGGLAGLGRGQHDAHGYKKGKMDSWERDLVEAFIKQVKSGQLHVVKGGLARSMRKYVNSQRHQEFYEKLVSRRKLNTALGRCVVDPALPSPLLALCRALGVVSPGQRLLTVPRHAFPSSSQLPGRPSTQATAHRGQLIHQGEVNRQPLHRFWQLIRRHQVASHCREEPDDEGHDCGRRRWGGCGGVGVSLRLVAAPPAPFVDSCPALLSRGTLV